jgi:flagellar biosynthesis protein FlhG
MQDQAQKLRQLAEEFRRDSMGITEIAESESQQDFGSNESRVIAVASGKGGVGKTNLVANLGIALAKTGKKVLIFDADLGLANVDILLNINPPYNLQHLISGQKQLKEIIVEGPHGIRIIPGASGIAELANLSEDLRDALIATLASLETDIILIDTGAGISRNILDFVLAAGEAIIVTTPDPTAMTDAYGLIKAVTKEDPGIELRLLVNMAKSEKEAKEISERIGLVAKNFLGKQIEMLGHIVTDAAVGLAVRRQEAFILSYPNSGAAFCVNMLTAKIDREIPLVAKSQSLRTFFSRLFIGGRAYEAS